YYVVIPLLFIPSSHRSAPPSFPTRRSSDLRIGAASLTRIRIRDHEVTERRKLGLRVQLDAAPRELDCLVKIAAIETELCEKQMSLRECGIAVDCRPERVLFLRHFAQCLEDFAEVEFGHVASRMRVDFLLVLGNRRVQIVSPLRRKRQIEMREA